MEKAKESGKKGRDKKKIISIITFVVGIILLIAGVVFLVLGIMKGSNVADGDYLVEKKSWVLADSDKVQWDFTEIGKGKLTTNNHENDYDFIWALEDGKLKIETSWLYEVNNEYEYEIDQNSDTLTLKADGETYTFKSSEGSQD